MKLLLLFTALLCMSLAFPLNQDEEKSTQLLVTQANLAEDVQDGPEAAASPAKLSNYLPWYYDGSIAYGPHVWLV
jgi:hypothetical protein